ncbi:hypothetical protein EJ02DRAFT_90863 [Clathrospora elynae]|uniref:Uncharacterized protein n=1 Tax=Clathrospora elynae TaxID=706981 RepID=A0A6A5T5M5_9PLEO|nr:hypothetical protein EJ02DRAFT_90863 [Clathrospora elynae]
MGKRHNRKRTRSRPRNRDGGNTTKTKKLSRSESADTTSSYSTTNSSFQPQLNPVANVPTNYWHQRYSAWQDRLRIEQERVQEVESQRLRIFGGLPEDEACLLEPMLKVVTDLFDGFTDYEDP